MYIKLTLKTKKKIQTKKMKTKSKNKLKIKQPFKLIFDFKKNIFLGSIVWERDFFRIVF